MKVRVIDKPCLFAETVYLLYYYINGIAYTRDYERVNRKFGRYLLEKEDQGLQLAQELDRISAAVTQTLDPHQARLPCSMEARWEILRVLTEFETYLRELTELLRPVAEQLAAEMQALTERNRAQLAIWEKYFQTHSVDTFQQEMFRASYLFTQEMQPDEVWIALWNFNMVGFWTEWFESGGKTVRIAYLGANLSFEFAAAHQVRPDAETLCAMMRALTGKDKLEILRRCAAEPFSAAQLAASMNLNSGTVSRNVYGLYKLGYLETRGDGERVNYITRPDALERLFHWVLEYVSEQK